MEIILLGLTVLIRVVGWLVGWLIMAFYDKLLSEGVVALGATANPTLTLAALTLRTIDSIK